MALCQSWKKPLSFAMTQYPLQPQAAEHPMKPLKALTRFLKTFLISLKEPKGIELEKTQLEVASS
jgi:hypothetical protein